MRGSNPVAVTCATLCAGFRVNAVMSDLISKSLKEQNLCVLLKLDVITLFTHIFFKNIEMCNKYQDSYISHTSTICYLRHIVFFINT